MSSSSTFTITLSKKLFRANVIFCNRPVFSKIKSEFCKFELPKNAIRFFLSISLEILSFVRICSLAFIIACRKSVVDFDLLRNELPRFNELIALSEAPN